MEIKKYLQYLCALAIDPIRIIKFNHWKRNTTREYPEISIGKSLSKFEGCSKGKRCFIVGNGPSLRSEDLDLICQEDCFAANGIWKIYEKTDWRATFYFIGDPKYASAIGDNIKNPISFAKECFFVFTHIKNYPEILFSQSNVNFYYQPIHTIYKVLRDRIFGKGLPKFSEDITKDCFSCGTITYEMLQVAMYMGYEKIYLLGIDHTYLNGAHFSGCSETSNNQIVQNLKSWENGYLQAKVIAEKKGVSIFNATRGGQLEVFERMDFDKIQF